MAHCEEYVELISAGLDGALSPAEQERLSAHLAGCSECQALYDDLSALHAALAELPPAQVPEGLKGRVMETVAAETEGAKVVPFAPKNSPRHWRRWLASAAAVALVVMGAWSWKPWEGRADLPHSAESAGGMVWTWGDNDANSLTPMTGSDGAAPAAPIPAPTLLPDPAAAPAEAAAKAEETAPAPSDSGISALSTEIPAEGTAYGFTSVGQAPDAVPPEEAAPLEEVAGIQSSTYAVNAAGDGQPAPMPRLFSIAPTATQYVPFPGEEGVLEQNVTSQAQAVNVLVGYIYEFVGEVELVEDGLAMNYAVNSPTGVSGTVACVGEDEEVYFLNYWDDLSPEVLNYSVRKDSGQVTLLGQDTPAAEEAAP